MLMSKSIDPALFGWLNAEVRERSHRVFEKRQDPAGEEKYLPRSATPLLSSKLLLPDDCPEDVLTQLLFRQNGLGCMNDREIGKKGQFGRRCSRGDREASHVIVLMDFLLKSGTEFLR